jgi:hypothetical protein
VAVDEYENQTEEVNSLEDYALGCVCGGFFVSGVQIWQRKTRGIGIRK